MDAIMGVFSDIPLGTLVVLIGLVVLFIFANMSGKNSGGRGSSGGSSGGSTGGSTGGSGGAA